MISSWSKRMFNHTEIETRARPLREDNERKKKLQWTKAEQSMPVEVKDSQVVNFFSQRRSNDDIWFF